MQNKSATLKRRMVVARAGILPLALVALFLAYNSTHKASGETPSETGFNNSAQAGFIPFDA